MSLKIKGTGYYLPKKVLTNDDLAGMVDTNDEWIRQRVGIHERRVCTDETTHFMAAQAAKNALDNAGVDPSAIDLIIASTITGETLSPTVAALVERELGASCPAFDISSACSGFLFALDTADAFMRRGTYRNILIVSSERVSKIIDWTDRSTCVIFGDGAGACVVSPGNGYLSSMLFTEGGREVIDIPTFVGTSPFYTGEDKKPVIFMDGQETFKFAVNHIVHDISSVVASAGLSMEDIDFIVPHQANVRIIEYASKRLKVPMEKFFVNMQLLGNTSSASVPIALAQLAETGKLKEGMNLALAAFGGGLSSAACVIRW